MVGKMISRMNLLLYLAEAGGARKQMPRVVVAPNLLALEADEGIPPG